jgi:hypothetical protein
MFVLSRVLSFHILLSYRGRGLANGHPPPAPAPAPFNEPYQISKNKVQKPLRRGVEGRPRAVEPQGKKGQDIWIN